MKIPGLISRLGRKPDPWAMPDWASAGPDGTFGNRSDDPDATYRVLYVGASAPLIAWLATRGRWGMRLALAWNVLGLLALTNVVIRAVLTAPGPFSLIHAEVPNQMLGMFPFLFIPGFFVPLALVLHVLAIRAISSRSREGKP